MQITEFFCAGGSLAYCPATFMAIAIGIANQSVGVSTSRPNRPGRQARLPRGVY